jgi:hypothetical protein
MTKRVFLGLLALLAAGRASPVVPFLDRMVNEFPVAAYPADPPAPRLSDLLGGWNVMVRIGSRFERVYRPGDVNKTLLIELQGWH